MKIQYLDYGQLAGVPVRVYRNLKAKDRILYSVQAHKVGIGWRVVGHTEIALLSDVVFVVSESGRERVLRQKSKNVHAFIYGVLVEGWALINMEGIQVTYNPYHGKTFYSRDTKEPIHTAKYCSIGGAGVMVHG